MPRKKAGIKGNIAKYFIKREEGEKAREGTTTTDPSRMFQLNRMEGTGQGEAGPTHDKIHDTTRGDTRKMCNEHSSYRVDRVPIDFHEYICVDT